MGWAGALYWLLGKRLRSSWALLTITAFGILAAVTLMAVGPAYSRALAEGGLRHTLAATSPTVLNTHIVTQNRPLGPADYQNLRAVVEEITADRLGFMLRDAQRFGRTQPNLALSLTSATEAPPLGAPIGRPFFLTDFEKHTRLVAGRWPQAAPVLHEEGLDMEMVVGERTAATLGLDLDSQVYLFPFGTDPSERITLTVVGLAEPIDPRQEYWMNAPLYFSVQEYGERPLVPIYVPEDAFFQGLGARYPSLVGDFGWFLFLDTSVLTAGTVAPTMEAVAALEADINKHFPRSLVLTGLNNTLSDYQRELTLARVPLYLFISLVVLVVLYFLALVIGLMGSSHSDEAGLLKSRGASTLQVSGLLVLGEGIVVLAAVVAGPFLALALVRYLLLGTINPAGEVARSIPVGLSGDMFIMGAVGGLLSLGVLVASSLRRARLGMVESLRARARPPSVPFLHRYYVDVLVVAALGLLWWQIQGRGGFVSRELAGRTLQVDPSLLFGPVLALLAVAFLVLRLLPWLVRALGWAASRLGPAWLAFALVRLARDPVPHGSLAIILMLAAALGVFGASFQSTLSRSQREQALYRVGGDLVVSDLSFPASTREAMASVPGVQTHSPVFRDSATLLDGFPNASATFLAVDPDTLPATVWFREDFAGKSLPELLAPLSQTLYVVQGSRQGPAAGIPLPEGAESVGVWVNLDNLEPGAAGQGLNLWARLHDRAGRYRSVFLGDVLRPAGIPPDLPSRAEIPPSPPLQRGGMGGPPQGWAYFQAPLPDASAGTGPPFHLASMFLSKSSYFRLPPGSISFDDITVEGRALSSPEGSSLAPGRVVVEGFETPGAWVPLANEESATDSVEYSPQAARTGEAGLTLSWQDPFGGASRGVLVPPGPFPLPAVGGPIFQVGQRLRVKVQRQVVPVVISDVTGYFPTIMDPSARPFLLVSLADYQEYTQRVPLGAVKLPEEVWLALEDSADRGQVARTLDERLGGFVSIQDRDGVVDVAQRDPLAGGGWDGLTILSMAALTLAAVLTLGIHAIASVRTGRVDLTIARTLGLSRLQLFLSLALERIVVAAVGIVAGSVLGIWLGRWVLSFLDITARGQPVIPPMVITVQEWLVALALAGLLAASLVALLLAALAAHRLRAPDVLRAAE